MNLDDAHIESLIAQSHSAHDQDDGMKIRILARELQKERRTSSRRNFAAWFNAAVILGLILIVVAFLWRKN